MVRDRAGRLAALAAFLMFAAVATLPLLYTGVLASHAKGSQSARAPWTQAAQAATGMRLPGAPQTVNGVTLSATASPMRPMDARPQAPNGDPTHMAVLVGAEDQRLHLLLHHATRITAPALVTVPGSVPTLILPARPSGYTLADLQSTGAVVPTTVKGEFQLVDSVLVMPSATLSLGGSSITSLLMTTSAAGITSLVTWGGTLTIAGDSAQAPLTIIGWDQARNEAAVDRGDGRPYIRAVGGKLELRDVWASSLGFYSGRTGGVAWTGVSSRPATGGAVSSTFTGDTYGAFVAHSRNVKFSDDLFQGNELDGLRLHRDAVNSSVIRSAAARNGGNGFVVSRGATGDALRGDVAVNNAGNGFLLDGQPLVNGASPSGRNPQAAVGTILDGSDAEANGRTGILVEGGTGTLLQHNMVCGAATAIAIRSGASATAVVGNDVRCGGHVALSIGPAVTGTTVSGNTFGAARIGVLVRNSPGVRLMANRFTGITVFALSVRGSSPGVVGNDNSMAGQALQPIDVQNGAPAPLLTNTDLTGWERRSNVTVLGYLRFHPLLTTWLVILIVVAVCWVASRRRRRPAHPYAHVPAWEPAEVHLIETMPLPRVSQPVNEFPHELAPVG